jgi:hypothetical protein
MARKIPTCWSFIVVTILALSGCSVLKGFFTKPEDIKFNDPARAVIDARQLIKEQNSNPNRTKVAWGPDELPESLGISGLRYALVHDDHIDLILAKHPDGHLGARIWSLEAKREHMDKPTKYQDIFFYLYDNDSPESPRNIP